MLPIFFLITVLCTSVWPHSICDSYSQLESEVHCGSKGYLMHYGFRNCNNFFRPSTYNLYTPAGKRWIDCTGNCLVEKARGIVAHTKNCAAIQTDAFDSHVGCYMTCGFRDIFSSNIKALAKTYELKDLLKFQTWKQALQIIIKIWTNKKK